MEATYVEIKKTKFTRAIYKQIVMAEISNLEYINRLEVIGWIYDKSRFVILLDKANGVMYKMGWYSDIHYAQGVIFLIENKARKHFRARFADEAKDVCHSLIVLMNDARNKGQIFIL